MNIGRVLKTVIKLAPIIYPIVRKLMNEKKSAGTTSSRK
jgi:hypothetical protein